MTAPTLRDRKKAATADALHRAAMRLAIANGLGSVTVEAIADEAQVSRRTFSNYFANKEDALLYGYRERMGTVLDALRERPDAEPPWQALRAGVADTASGIADPDPQWVAQSRLVRRHPSLLAQQMAVHAAFEQDLAEELTRRTGDPARSRLLAAAFLAGLRVGSDIWLERQGADPLPEMVDRALATLAEPFA
jgi:AcrR family transcriptional regulator